LINQVISETNRTGPIGFIWDKITPNRRTMHIVGFYSYIGGKMQPLVAGVRELKAEHRLAVTESLIEGLSSLKISKEDLPGRL